MVAMRSWVVGGAVIEGPGGVLLVQNRRRGGRHDWTPPGGVIETAEGEDLLAGLAREVLEETGITVTEWDGPIYRIRADAPDLGWTLDVECYRAVHYQGDLSPDDPDGIVVDARYVPHDDCGVHLAGNHPWVAEPLLEWLAGRWAGSRSFAYHVAGDDMAGLVVTRL
jgi:8-oxo-dGTP pyrophosphatase MutT (NUDIX family)